MKIITSFSEEGYARYGRRFLESYVTHWPVPIIVYHEGEPPDFEHALVSYKNLYEVYGCAHFLQCTAMLPVFAGGAPERDYRYDVFRFCRKSFAQIDAARGHDGLLFWVDADVVTLAPITEGWLRAQLEGTFMAYLGRPTWHSCTSFVGWDCGHPQAEQFWKAYLGMYLSGQVLRLKEWHDCFVLDMLREAMKLEARDLAADIKLPEGPANVFDYVFQGKARHFKGNMKLEAA